MLSTNDTITIVVVAVGIPLAVLFLGYLYHYLQKQHQRELLRLQQSQENKKSSSAISGNLVKEYSSVINILDHYRLTRILLGRGSSAEVFVSEQIRNRHRYAIKIIDLSRKEVIWRYEKEKKFLKDIEHCNIIRLFEIYNTPKKMFFVMELCTGGHLGQLLKKPTISMTESNKGKREKRAVVGKISRSLRHESHQMRSSNDDEEIEGIRYPNNPHHLSELQVREYILQITRAIIHCHNHGICHRDLKLQNILLENHSKDAQIKIIDFGNAVHFIGCTPLKKVVGTTYTAAPEVFRQEYDERCDIWSLGVITYILLSGRRPFERVEIDQTTTKQRKSSRNSRKSKKIPLSLTAAQKQVLPTQYHSSSEGSVIASILLGRYHFHHESFRYVSKEAISFVQFCMELDYKQRPYARDLLSHPWLRPDFISTCYLSQFSPRDSDLSPTDEASLPFTYGTAISSSRQHQGLMSMIPLISQTGMKTLIDSTSRHLKNPNFTGMRDASMLAIAFSMPIAKVKKLRILFQEIDYNGNGLIGKTAAISVSCVIFSYFSLFFSCFFYRERRVSISDVTSPIRTIS
jgi:serine/threonine protein kinase